jgi:hypothetical protein
MKPKLSTPKAADNERRNVRHKLVRRSAELALNHGRAADHPAHEDVQQARREVKPLNMPKQQIRPA